jgi:excisionase family DNA binding protein
MNMLGGTELGLLTYAETAKLLRVSERTVWSLCHKAKRLPYVAMGRRRLIRRNDVEAFVVSQTQNSSQTGSI